MNNIKWYKKPEMIVAFSALLISVVTAIIGIYSAYIDRAYARASVWPRVEVFRSFGDQHFEYGVTNAGTGPALIKYAKIEFENKAIKLWGDIPNIPDFTQSHLSSRILPSQSTIKPIVYKGKESSEFLKIDESINISICYCSIYDECWVTNRSNNPKEIESCIIKNEVKFSQ